MADLREQIKADMKAAMKEKRVADLSVLRTVNGEISALEKEKDEITDEDVIEVLNRETKKRREAIEEAQSAGRADTAEQEQAELEVLERYLPDQLSEEELRDIVREVINETGAESPEDMGQVMGALMPKIKGRADGSDASRIAKELLGN